MEIDPQYSIAGVLAAFCSALLTMTWKGGKWLANRLFNEETGYLTRLINAHLRLIDAVETMPASVQKILETDQEQTALLEGIAESQTGIGSHPRLLHEKFDMSIDADICMTSAIESLIADDKSTAAEYLQKSKTFLTKAREL